jgi:hypothetical protein
MKAILAALLVSCSVLAVAGDREWSIGNIVPPNASATALCQAFSTKQEYEYLGIGSVSRPEPKVDLYMAKCLFRFANCTAEECNQSILMSWTGEYCPTGQIFNNASGLCEKAKPEPVEPPKDPDQLSLSIQKGRINDALSCGAPSRSWGKS